MLALSLLRMCLLFLFIRAARKDCKRLPFFPQVSPIAVRTAYWANRLSFRLRLALFKDFGFKYVSAVQTTVPFRNHGFIPSELDLFVQVTAVRAQSCAPSSAQENGKVFSKSPWIEPKRRSRPVRGRKVHRLGSIAPQSAHRHLVGTLGMFLPRSPSQKAPSDDCCCHRTMC